MGKIKDNIPYGATPLEDYSGLKLNHINTLQGLYEAEFYNITLAASKYLLKQLSLNKLQDREYFFKIHRSMFFRVWKWAGQKRNNNKSIGVDKFQIDTELLKFTKNFEFWELSKMSPIEISARIHQNLVFIHPFENGNGRWARLVTNIYLKIKLQQIILWPEQELYISNTFRKRYIEALRSADKGNFFELMRIHSDMLG